MARAKTFILGLGTVFCALGIGYIMQFGLALPGGPTLSGPQDIRVSAITDTSSASATRLVPPRLALPAEPDANILRAAVDSGHSAPNDTARDATGCDVDMNARPGAAAMVTLDLVAPCQGGERVTIHHNGLMFTGVTEADGSLRIDVPVLTEKALFIASFDNGSGAVVHAEVPTLKDYDRVVLQWKGNTGLQLHAREFDAPYGSEGHIWRAASGDIGATTQGRGGFLTRLGRADSPEALIAEIYSFPAGRAETAGQVALSIEAEITAANCGTEIEAQSMELVRGASLQVHDISLAIPDCDSIGDFLVLKKPLQDLTIASN